MLNSCKQEALTLASPDSSADEPFTFSDQDDVHFPLQKFFKFVFSPERTITKFPSFTKTPAPDDSVTCEVDV